MEIVAPNSHAKTACLCLNMSPAKYKTLHSFTPNTPTQTQLPLRRPEYKPPPRSLDIRPSLKKPNPKPVTTTSDVLYLMDSLKLPVPVDIYTSLVKECAEFGDPLKAIELHQHVIRSRLRLNLPLLNRLLLMYVSVGCVEHARQLFDQMSVTDFNSWAVVIAGCVENGKYKEAIELFIRMLRKKELEKIGDYHTGFSGILVCVLKACLYTKNFELGMQVHGWLWKMGCSRSAALSSCLINFYGKLKYFEGAQSVFEQVPCRNIAVWTSRIVNYCIDDNFEGVVSVFKEMGREGVRKNGYTFSTVLKACGRMKDIGCGRQLHANLMKLGLETNGFVQCALVDLYGKCGFLNDAARMFEIGRNKKNQACFNAMLTNYMGHGLCVEAIKVLYEMKIAGFRPSESVFHEMRCVCGSRFLEKSIDENVCIEL